MKKITLKVKNEKALSGHRLPSCGVFKVWVGKFTLIAFEGKFGAFVAEFKMGAFGGFREGLMGKWAVGIYCKLKYRGCDPDTVTADGKADRNSARFIKFSVKGL